MVTVKKKKAAKKKQCKCVELANKSLEAHNAQITQAMVLNFKTGKAGLGGPQIAVEKINPKKRRGCRHFSARIAPYVEKNYRKNL